MKNKIPDTSNLVKKTDYNTKITELENKIPSISNLVKILKEFKEKQILKEKLQKSKRNLLIKSMINILMLQRLIL